MRNILPLFTAALALNCWTGAASAQVGMETSPAAVELLNLKSQTLPAGVERSDATMIMPGAQIDSSPAPELSKSARMLMHVDMSYLKIEAEQTKAPSLKSKTELSR